MHSQCDSVNETVSAEFTLNGGVPFEKTQKHLFHFSWFRSKAHVQVKYCQNINLI